MNDNICIDSLQNNPLTPIHNLPLFEQNLLEDDFLSKEEIQALKMMDPDDFQKFCLDNNINVD
jgi:hypothetical protein